jgi:hypothetical protein
MAQAMKVRIVGVRRRIIDGVGDRQAFHARGNRLERASHL